MYLSKRRGIWYLFFVDETGAQRKRSTHSRTKPDALAFVKQFNAEEDERRRKLKPISLSDFQRSYVAYSRSIHTKKTVEASESALRLFTKSLTQETALHTITATDCERFLAAKSTEASAWSARKYYLALSASFERAKLWGHILDNPWRKVKKPKPAEVIPAFFTRDEFKVLCGKIEDRDFRELVVVGALTGLRLGELTAAEWDWFDLKRRTVTVQNLNNFTTKSKKVRVVPLCDEALTVLLARNERSRDAKVFTVKGRSLDRCPVSHTFKKHVRAAKLNDRLHFHSLRHTFASWLVQGGVSLYQVTKLLGHSSTAVTEIYAHLVPSDMHGVLGPLHLEN